MPERFGWFKRSGKGPSIWIHAVSVGETVAVLPLVKRLQSAYPQFELVVTSTTPTGSARVKAALGDSVFHVYAPYDAPGCVKRFLKKTQPVLAIFVETELWPNYLAFCRQQSIPTVLFNARLSERSLKRYLKVSRLAATLVRDLTSILAQTPLDAEHFKQLGATTEQITVTGSVKFDIDVSPDTLAQGLALKTTLGTDRPIWIAASTHAGEESIVLSAHQALLKTQPNALLILVPRHPNRFAEVAQLCDQTGLRTAKRSLQATCAADTQVYLGDTMGELLLLYTAADVTFVGGSFVSVGGHNMLEPAALKKPILTGPCVINFLRISELLKAAQGLQFVKDAAALSDAVATLFQAPNQAIQMGERAFGVVQQNRGALDRQFQLIKKFCTSSKSR